jgi:hypothetical protein
VIEPTRLEPKIDTKLFCGLVEIPRSLVRNRRASPRPAIFGGIGGMIGIGPATILPFASPVPSPRSHSVTPLRLSRPLTPLNQWGSPAGQVNPSIEDEITHIETRLSHHATQNKSHEANKARLELVEREIGERVADGGDLDELLGEEEVLISRILEFEGDGVGRGMEVLKLSRRIKDLLEVE